MPSVNAHSSISLVPIRTQSHTHTFQYLQWQCDVKFSQVPLPAIHCGPQLNPNLCVRIQILLYHKFNAIYVGILSSSCSRSLETAIGNIWFTLDPLSSVLRQCGAFTNTAAAADKQHEQWARANQKRRLHRRTSCQNVGLAGIKMHSLENKSPCMCCMPWHALVRNIIIIIATNICMSRTKLNKISYV